VNDATGLVAYKFALAAAMTGQFSLGAVGGRFLLVAGGGVAVGLAVGWLVAAIHRRLDNFEVETVITLLTPYAAYIPAEHLHVSGVLATVAAGGYLGWRNPQLLSALTRFRGIGVWSVLLVLFNGLVFILIGLQLGAIRELAAGVHWSGLIARAVVVTLVTIAVRLAYVPVATYLPRLLSRRLRQRDPAPPLRAVVLIGWTGMRGIVSLALALALPLALPDGRPFPQRAVVVVVSFAVILTTLVLQGLSLPFVIRALRFEQDSADLREEREALIRASQLALTRLDEIDSDQALGAERSAVVALRNEGKISEEVLHRVQQALDLEALQPDR
jgi:NhaP-type Na+/H+ or K+/H+ antiporter